MICGFSSSCHHSTYHKNATGTKRARAVFKRFSRRIYDSKDFASKRIAKCIIICVCKNARKECEGHFFHPRGPEGGKVIRAADRGAAFPARSACARR